MYLGSAMVTIGVFCTSCIRPYNVTPVVVSKDSFHTTFPSRYSPEGFSLKENWEQVDSGCHEIRSRMSREADLIVRRNAVIGALFSGLTAGLALSSSIYATAADNPNKKTLALLTLGAGGTTIPTFFYFGSDERVQTLRDRMKTIDDKQQSCVALYESLKQADRGLDAAKRRLDQAQSATPPEGNLGRIQEDISASRASYQKAQDDLDTCLISLAQVCK
jgi:hypothetical protein